MKYEFSATISIDIAHPNLEEIVSSFASIFVQLFRDYCTQVLLCFAEEYMARSVKPFSCNRCGNKCHFIWKTRHGKQTSILTIPKLSDFLRRRAAHPYLS